MIRPVSFRMNEQTAVNNFFQKEISNALVANKKAQQEFDSCVALLRKKRNRCVGYERHGSP
jgi:hypothetical protein